MTHVPLKITVAAAFAAAGVVALPMEGQARIPCDSGSGSTTCPTVIVPLTRTPQVPHSSRAAKKVQSSLAIAALMRAEQTGQFGGPFDPRRADG